MRILIVAQDFPWPSRYGSRIRLANVVRALGHLGDVDLFTFLWPGGEWEPPAAGAVKRWQMVPRPLARRTPLRRLAWILGGRAPSDFLGRDFEAVREAFTAWAQPRYDLIWFSRIEPYVAFGSLVDGPVILDIDDLADWRLRTRAAAGLGNDSAGAISWPSIRTLPKRLKDRKDIRLWDRLQKRLAGSVAAAVVCSEQDRQRVGVSNVVVVPNGYEAPARPAGRLATGRPPTVLFPATFGYPPNLDAARYLVQEIAPLLGARVGDLQIRLVGKAVRAVRELADPPRVVVTGAVPEMDPELRHADIVAVPIRIGTGTRIKVLEAFAHKMFPRPRGRSTPPLSREGSARALPSEVSVGGDSVEHQRHGSQHIDRRPECAERIRVE